MKRLKDREEYGSWQKLTDAINIMQGETHKPISRQACFSWASKGPIPVDRVPALVEPSYNDAMLDRLTAKREELGVISVKKAPKYKNEYERRMANKVELHPDLQDIKAGKRYAYPTPEAIPSNAGKRVHLTVDEERGRLSREDDVQNQATAAINATYDILGPDLTGGDDSIH